MKTVFRVLMAVFIVSCNTNNNGDVPPERKTVNPDPVKTYDETVKSFETTDEFKVSVYETKETFRYLIKIQYKSLDEEDTLRIPDFGVQPAVVIEKGDSLRPSCIVGFLDDKKQFRESKLIYFDDNTLKVHVLKHYGVATYQSAAP
jgi:hypothetical protein